MIFFFRSIFIQTLLNAFVVYRIQKNREISRTFKHVLTVLYIIETLMYFVGLLASRYLSVSEIGLIHKISGVWVIFQVYLVLWIFLFDFILLKVNRLRLRKKKQRRVKIVSFCTVVLFVWLQLYIGYRNYVNPVVLNYDFEFNSPENTDKKPFQEYKLLLVSDMHLGYIVDKEMLKKYVKLINSQHPDIVVINGDLIDYDLRPLVETGMDEELRKIKAKKGVFFIPGNHEYKVDAGSSLNWIAQNGMKVLKDTIVTIDNNLCLIGRDDASNDEKRKPMSVLMKQLDVSKPCIMFAHQPADIEDACQYKIPLTLCGHTHRGQIFPANLVAHWLYINSYGWHDEGECKSYTTSGLGLSGFPMRIGSRSEVVVFEIKIY